MSTHNYPVNQNSFDEGEHGEIQDFETPFSLNRLLNEFEKAGYTATQFSRYFEVFLTIDKFTVKLKET